MVKGDGTPVYREILADGAIELPTECRVRDTPDTPVCGRPLAVSMSVILLGRPVLVGLCERHRQLVAQGVWPL
jgi:hypothetical protein